MKFYRYRMFFDQSEGTISGAGFSLVQRLDLIKGVRSKIRLYMRTFSIIPDSTQKIYKEMIVLDGVPDFHPP